LSGDPRPLCFRRACPGCGRREEIEHFGHVVAVDGVEYMADPYWRESEPNSALCVKTDSIDGKQEEA
jgi:hypothetical protein